MLQVQDVHAAAAPPVLALLASALANVRTLHLLSEVQPMAAHRVQRCNHDRRDRGNGSMKGHGQGQFKAGY